MGYIRKALEKGYLEHPGSACCTDDMFQIFVRFGRYLCCSLPPFVNRQLQCHAMDRALHNVDYYYGLTDMAGMTIQHVVLLYMLCWLCLGEIRVQ